MLYPLSVQSTTFSQTDSGLAERALADRNAPAMGPNRQSAASAIVLRAITPVTYSSMLSATCSAWFANTWSAPLNTR